MNHAERIKPHMPVVCSKGKQFAVVDHMDGDSVVKLSRDSNGQHHYIPMSWVTAVNNEVHLNRPGDEIMRQWLTSAASAEAEERRAQRHDVTDDPTHTERVRSQQGDPADPTKDPERAERLRSS